ncbi:hypothetical protein AGMMS50239_32780 [Bacteroidia bacterium]|nr:hypothetical protein AGMMS50239_32780 [Bacteroidia bacterium]
MCKKGKKKFWKILGGTGILAICTLILFFQQIFGYTIRDFIEKDKTQPDTTITQQPPIVEIEVKDSANVDVINQQIGGIGNTQNNNTTIYK